MKYQACFGSLALLLALAVAGCGERADRTTTDELATDTAAPTAVTPLMAVARLQPLGGSNVQGTLNFVEEGDQLRVSGQITGLTGDQHAWHIHEVGDCSAPDGMSAGGHFAPEGSPHGAPDAAHGERHAGDFGNLQVGTDGTADVQYTDHVARLSGPTSIVGRSVIVHEGVDDFTTQPTGDAGGRLACGIVEPLDGAGAQQPGMAAPGGGVYPTPQGTSPDTAAVQP
jgi:superoxide dismutase, Cu-Zn family